MFLITLFARHRNAAHLLMLIMILSGIWGVGQLNTQFLPNFDLNFITVTVVWTGASSEDVQRAITIPLEQELRNTDYLKNMTSTSALGRASVTLEFHESTDMPSALAQVDDKVKQIQNLPDDSEPPMVQLLIFYEPIAKLIVTTVHDLDSLRPVVYQMEKELLDRGIAKIDINGLPEQEISIQVPSGELFTHQITLDAIAKRIQAHSVDFPAGTVGRDVAPKVLRSLEQGRQVEDFQQLVLLSDARGQFVRLGDIAQITKRNEDNTATITYHDRPAVELSVWRSRQADALTSAEILDTWLAEQEQQLPNGVEIVRYDERWEYIEQRIHLLLKNGAGGLALVLLLLFTFLNVRVAFWVAAGIPTAFLATLAICAVTGNSINMISLFALIMTLGIVVDDAIVVAENTLVRSQQGDPPLTAVIGGAKRMLAPVMSSSLTTICAFIPLLLVGGMMGQLLMTIPLIVIFVIIASLIECFLVLPGHLHHSLRRVGTVTRSDLRKRLDAGFEFFKMHYFRPFLILSLGNRLTTVMMALGLFVIAVSLVLSQHILFTFFPSPEQHLVTARLQFSKGTPPDVVKAFVHDMQVALEKTDQALGGGIVRTNLVRHGVLVYEDPPHQVFDEQVATISVELTPSDARDVRTPAFIEAWRKHIPVRAGIEELTIYAMRTGPPGKDIEIVLKGDDIDVLKKTSNELQSRLNAFTGVSAVRDDLPLGEGQIHYHLSPYGKALGLTASQIGQTLRASVNGQVVQTFYEQDDEIDVRVRLPDTERNQFALLNQLPIITPAGNVVPLGDVIIWDERIGFSQLRHDEGQLAITVTADVDDSRANSDLILSNLQKTYFSKFAGQYGIHFETKGLSQEQAVTFNQMMAGAVLAIILIYIVLAWVFSSYSKPLIVLCAIPFGLTGALFGHWLLGIQLTLLSLFGMFGLAGIVINDAIILIRSYQQHLEQGLSPSVAVIDATCERLRAVILTSLTTIAGLTPLLFETSLQAQFLIPMAVSITFGLAFSTLLILVLIPTLLSLQEAGYGLWRGKIQNIKS